MDRLERIRRWQWMMIAALIGLSIGWSRSAWITRAGAFGETLNNAFRFERGLDANVHNEAKFQVISVFMFEMPDEDGTSHRFHAVQGILQDWDPQRGGMTQRPTTFIAPVPYHPKNLDAISSNGSSAATSAVKDFSALPQPTVVDYLNLLRKTQGLKFENAWWDTHPYWTWLTSSVLLIGGVLPSAINIALFGTIRRPREEKGASLWAVENPRLAAKPVPAEADLGALNSRIAELEADIELPPPPSATPPAKAVAVRTLAAATSDSAPVVHGSPAKDFGADKDDFYPTEQKARKFPPEPTAKR